MIAVLPHSFCPVGLLSEPLLKQIFSNGRAINVVAITMIIGSDKPAWSPVAAIINATSPLDIIPDPTANDDLILNPVILPLKSIFISTTMKN